MTKPICIYDVSNFHSYLDDIDNYAIILKLENGSLVAAFSEAPLNQHINNTGKGLIASLTNKSAIYIDQKLPNTVTTKYNAYYVVFGNDELRILPTKK